MSEVLNVEKLFGENKNADIMQQDNIELFFADTDDAWARDVAPTFVKSNKHNTANSNKEGSDQSSNYASDSVIRAVNWEFNAWGGNVDGLYASWEKDNAFASAFADQFGFDWYDAAPFVLEGGSIHSDGEGTLLTTESCLLSAGRNMKTYDCLSHDPAVTYYTMIIRDPDMGNEIKVLFEPGEDLLEAMQRISPDKVHI